MIIETEQGEAKSNSNEKSVLLITSSDQIAIDLSEVVASIPNHELNAHTGTLAKMNGTAVDMVRSNDLVIFETDIGDTEDLSAVANLRRELENDAKILVVTSEDISLAQARQLTRAGADDVITYPFVADDLREQVERMTSPNPLVVIQQQETDETRLGHVIAVAKSCGGLGGTTVAVNLADRLLERTGVLRKTTQNRVVIVDLDLQFGSVGSFLDIEAKDSLYHLAADGAKPDTTFLQQSMSETESGLHVLTAPARFAPLNSLHADQIATMIDLLRREYDYVIVDLPHALVEWVAPVLERAGRLLMVTDCSVPSIRQARRLIDFFTQDNVGLQIEMVMNREKKPLVRGSVHKEAAKVLERPLNHWLPADSKAARAAVDRGQPLSEVAGRSHLAKAIGALAQSVATGLSANAPAATKVSK